MTAVEVNGQVVIFDIGADIERVIKQDVNIEDLKTIEAIEAKIVPNDSKIKNEFRDNVEAIVVGHGHQDHTRGLPKLAGAYDCPIIATPYTSSIIRRFMENDREKVSNKIIEINPGESIQISSDLELEFVDITHSIPQAAISVLKTPEGQLVYSLDFKLDKNPTLENPVNYDKLREIGDRGVKAYIVDCTRIDDPGERNRKRRPEKS